jgi:TRAP-type C4-dicarboxylate transport system permease small subunit
MGRNLLTIWLLTKICFFTFAAMVFVASWKRSVHAWSRQASTLAVDELPAYSKRTQADRRKSGGE